jgi:acetate---CoA ligase (ADP-forming)
VEDAVSAPATGGGGFGALTPLLAPRSVAVVGASDREGNLGGLAVQFLRKFGFQGPVWPVNAGRDTVAGLKCYPSLAALPATPDLAVLAVPADSVTAVVQDCADAGIPAAVAWAGGFAEGGPEGAARQRALEAACRATGIRLCGPNCIGIINTAIGLTASFSSLMTELDHFLPGHVSMVSQSGGIAVNAHAAAQALGLGFRVTISCGNEAGLGIPDFIRALVEDDGTRVIAVYTEGISDPAGFVAALAAARARHKPVVILKGGGTEQSSRAALAHTGRLAGSDRTYDAIFREFAAIRVFSPEEMLELCLQLAHLPLARLPAGNRVLISTFGGGSGVIATDQCVREGMTVPPLSEATRAALAPLMSPLGSALNPVDMTPGAVTNPKNRANLPDVLRILGGAAETDLTLFFASGFGALASNVAEMFLAMREEARQPVCLSWQSPPPGITEALNARGVLVFNEHARAIRAMGHIVRYAADLRHHIRRVDCAAAPFDWQAWLPPGGGVVSEDVASAALEAAGLPVARARLARTEEAATQAAAEVGLPVAMKGISAAVTHRAAAGLVALDIRTAADTATTFRRLAQRAEELGVSLDGVWVQHMFHGSIELLVTAIRDREFGMMVGVGMGGGMTEIIDDVVFTRAPIDAEGAGDLLLRLRTLGRLPGLLSPAQRGAAANFIAGFSALVATAPGQNFTFEVNPLKVGDADVAAVDALIVL